ncbi:MAG: hypothetical protein JSV86_05720 [Gemmatimonadota bacterium]|nr:MAG: hypothetical protein JSV86_05720 [Gemmatimonadota bacterium]
MTARQALNPSCPQCGGPVDVPEGVAYARCRYCGSESFVDLSGALLHQVIRKTVRASRVPGLLKARACEAGHSDAVVTGLKLFNEPIWEIESPDGRRMCISARPGPEGRFASVRLPGGERAFVEPEQRDGAAEWEEPELAPESLPEVAARATGRPVGVKTIRLIHRPIYKGTIRVSGKPSEFQLDGVSGELIDVDWPVQPSYTRRNKAWWGSAIMVLIAAALPIQFAAPAVVVIGFYFMWALSRPAAASGATP